MIRAIALRALSFALLWWVLTEGRTTGWGLGMLAVTAATAASLRLLPPHRRQYRRRIGILALLRFLAFFLWNSVRGGIQVAAMALRPQLDLRPTVLELFLVLPPGAPRILMLNTLGLMPGTIGVDLDDARLKVHVLDARLPVADEAKALEAHIARLFGVVP